MPDDSPKLALGDQEPRADPSLDLIARPPALHFSAHGFDDGPPPAVEGPILKLLVQPNDGIGPLLAGIKSAKKSIDILSLSRLYVQRIQLWGVVLHKRKNELECAVKTAQLDRTGNLDAQPDRRFDSGEGDLQSVDGRRCLWRGHRDIVSGFGAESRRCYGIRSP